MLLLKMYHHNDVNVRRPWCQQYNKLSNKYVYKKCVCKMRYFIQKSHWIFTFWDQPQWKCTSFVFFIRSTKRYVQIKKRYHKFTREMRFNVVFDWKIEPIKFGFFMVEFRTSNKVQNPSIRNGISKFFAPFLLPNRLYNLINDLIADVDFLRK